MRAAAGLAVAAAARWVPAEDRLQAGGANRQLLDGFLNLDSAAKDILRQERSQVMVHQIKKAAAAGGDKDLTAHATAAATRDGADAAGGVLSHLDRRRFLMQLRRQLVGVQENGVSSSALDLKDPLRLAAAAETRSRIRSAVAAGADQQVTTAAAQGITGVPLRLLRQNGVGAGNGLDDTIRAVQRQDRAATSMSMIRRAVDGRLEVSEAIARSQMAPPRGSLVAAETAAAPAAPQGRVLP